MSTDQLQESGASDRIRDRVAGLQAQIPANCKGRITMAVAVVEAPGGDRRFLVATSEPRGYLRAGVTLKDEEILVSGLQHAELDLVDYSKENGFTMIAIGATRPICPRCAEAIGSTGAEIATRVKVPQDT